MSPRQLRALALLVAAAATAAPARDVTPAAVRALDGLAILPPPPAPGSAAAAFDRQVFVATRALRGTPRWAIATDDVTNVPLDRFACAMGVQLAPRRAPALTRLLDRADTGGSVDRVKAAYQVPRPYLAGDAPICEPRTAHLAANGDYPSGHTARGWLEALVLAQVMPDRASAILARGRAYGESRAICGSHNRSAVEAGFLAGAAVFAVLQTDTGYRRDLRAARRDVARLRTTAPRPSPARCTEEARALAVRPW